MSDEARRQTERATATDGLTAKACQEAKRHRVCVHCGASLWFRTSYACCLACWPHRCPIEGNPLHCKPCREARGRE